MQYSEITAAWRRAGEAHVVQQQGPRRCRPVRRPAAPPPRPPTNNPPGDGWDL